MPPAGTLRGAPGYVPPIMDCGTFRENHAAFFDNALDERAMAAMRAHRAECAACAAHDTIVRRALLLVRNLPTIEPSPQFAARLDARLRQVAHAEGRRNVVAGPGLTSFATAAAALIAAGYIVMAALGSVETARAPELALSPVVVTAPVDLTARPLDPDSELFPASRLPATPTSPMVSPAIVASVSMGMPVWPAALLAAQAPMHFAASEFSLVSLGR